MTMFLLIIGVTYLIGFGVCRLAAMLLGSTESRVVNNVSFIPIVNFLFAVFAVLVLVYIFRDNNRKPKNTAETVGSSNG